MSDKQTESQAKADDSKRKIRCVVTSDRMNKSRVAKIERLVRHERLHKYLKRTTKIMFHDEKNDTVIGDEVLVMQTRPLSGNKCFELVSVVNRGEAYKKAQEAK